MKRRAFLGGALAAPIAACVPAIAAPVRGEFAYARGGDYLAIGWDYEEKPVAAWQLMVIDLDTGLEVPRVLACNAFKGTLERYTGAVDDDDRWVTEICRGNFAIVRKST